MDGNRKTKLRKAHRILGLILFLPLAWQAVTGYILYYRFDAAGKARPWKDLLVKLHNGELFGSAIFVIGLIYVVLILSFIVLGVLLYREREPDRKS